MAWRVVLSISVLVLVLVGSIFTKHGLLDLRKFSNEVSSARERVEVLENGNKELRRQLDLMTSPSPEVLEHQVREVMGWAKPGELVYVEGEARP